LYTLSITVNIYLLCCFNTKV